MSDIVTNARGLMAKGFSSAEWLTRAPTLMADLADEVERLRAELADERITVHKFQQEVGVDLLGLHDNRGPDEVAEAVKRLRSYKSLPSGMVWQDYYSPDDVCKIRLPLDDEIDRLRTEREVLLRALGDTQDETHRWRTKVCAALGVLPEIGPSMAAEMVTTLRERLRPRRIESVTELDALEVGAVVRDAEGWVWELTPSKWWGIGYGADQMKSSNINLPALLIWEPEAQ